MKMKKIILATLGVALVGIGANANAAKVTATISPQLTIAGACTIDTTAVVTAFANQIGGSTANAIPMAGGNLIVTCPGQAYSVGANAGLNLAVANTRRLALAGTFIPYKLTIDTIDWGDNGIFAIDPSAGADTMTDAAAFNKGAGGFGAVAGETYVVAGVTTAALAGTEAAGTYVDTVTITVAW